MSIVNQLKNTSKEQTKKSLSGLSVRTNLRAGIAWDDVDDQAISLWNKLKDSVSSATQAVTDTVKSATS